MPENYVRNTGIILCIILTLCFFIGFLVMLLKTNAHQGGWIGIAGLAVLIVVLFESTKRIP